MSNQRVATVADLRPGAIITVPPGVTARERPFCLLITHVDSVSKVTGAVDLMGSVLGLDGTTTRTRRLLRRIVTQPERVTIFREAPAG